ncbi:unnamed protein product [Lupinus luteus]|uniref:Retrovirus-related Pol polyprotein from transposon TNT 1-94 n=1 Tax=Lupinus luteus TaxID=3873 RepID=A0AAV1XAS9_LUPLU
MATDNIVQPAIPRFDGHYEHWSMLMENLLRSKEYWQVVEDGVATPEEGRELNAAQNREHDAMKLKDLRAKNFLFQAIDRSILETILCKETSKDIWDSMKKKYRGSSRVKCAQLQALRKDFETLQMKESESVTDYCSRVMGIANSMRIHGEKMGDTLIVEKILRSLTPKFDYMVCSIEESNDTDELSLDELQSSLLVHEQNMHRSSTVEEQALKASTKGRGRIYEKPKVECFRCHKFGHYASECYTKLPNYKGKGEQSNFVEEKEEETLLMTSHEKFQSDVWYVDTGCSNHMCGSKSSFTYLDENFRSKVSFGDCSTEKGYIITIQKDACEIYDPIRGAIVVVEMSSNRLFPLKIQSAQTCLVSEVKDPSWLWHFRYGHLNFNGLKTLHQKNMVEKSEALSVFQHDKALVEKGSGYAIKVLQSDRGGEYNSQEFVNFCDIHGIKRQLTEAYTPQQNGIAERKNRTILNMVRTILKMSGVPRNFWPEAVNWSIHLLDRNPTFAVKNMTPEEAWKGHKPSVEHFRIFGCITYAHVPDQKRKKLDDKAGAEFVAASNCACQAIWLRKILEELHFKKDDATIIYCDNTSAIKLSKNPVLHGRSKHIDVKYYFLRDLNNDGTIVLKYCRSEDQLADIFTKPLKAPSFQNLRNLLGVCMMQQQS